MKKKSVRIAYLLISFIFLFTYIGLSFGNIDSYAQDNKNYTVVALSASKPKSGGFSSGTKSYSTKPKTTIIKPDSGSFSTKPNTSNKTPNPSTTIKPDSGSFNTKPSTNTPSSSNNDKNYNDTPSSGGGYSRPLFGGGYYGGYSPFSRMFYGFSMSSWIIKTVSIITILVIAFIVLDYIRNKRD